MAFGIGFLNQDVIFGPVSTTAATLIGLVEQMWTETSKRGQQTHVFAASGKVSNAFHFCAKAHCSRRQAPGVDFALLAPDHIGVTLPRSYASLSQRNSTTATPGPIAEGPELRFLP